MRNYILIFSFFIFDCSSTKETDSDHGRVEHSGYGHSEDINSISDLANKWLGLNSIFKVKSERCANDEITTECRYYIL